MESKHKWRDPTFVLIEEHIEYKPKRKPFYKDEIFVLILGVIVFTITFLIRN